MDLQGDSAALHSGSVPGAIPIPRRSRAKVLEVVPEMTAKIDPSTGKQVMARNRRTRRLEPVMVSTGRWRLNGYYVAGKRVRRFYADEASAKADLERLKVEAGNVDAKTRHALANRNDLVQDAIRAHDLLKPHGLTVLEAAREHSECLGLLRPLGASLREVVTAFARNEQARRKSITIADLIVAFIADRQRTGKSKFYVDDLRKRLRRFEEWFGSDTMASDVTADGIVEWLGGLNVSPRTENNFLRNVGAAFSFALKRGFIGSNPFQAVDKSTEVQDPPQVLTPKEMASLLDHADPTLVPFLAIGGFAGLRPEEMRRLTWGNVDFESGLIEVEARKAKTAARRLVAMSDNLRAWLAPFRGADGPVVPANVRKLRLAAMAAAKIGGWPVDVLRHSFGSYHLAQHQDAAKTALEMGHTTTKTLFEHYRNLVKPAAARAWWSILSAKAAKNVVSITQVA